MENLTLAFLVKELRERLCGSVLEKVQQTRPVELVFKFRRGRLLISADDQHPTLYLMQHAQGRRGRASSPFLLLAQKHLVGGKLDELDQVDFDRVLRFRFTSRDESETPRRFTLVAELIDRRANLYLLDADDGIMERLVARKHEPQPVGETYKPPTLPGHKDFSTLTESEYEEITRGATRLSHALVHNIKGFSPLWAREVAWRSQHGPGYAAFRSVVQELAVEQPQPHIYSPVPLDQIRPGQMDWQKELILSPIPIHWPSKESGFVATQFANMLEAVERYEQLVDAIRAFQAQKQALATALHQQRKKAEKRGGRLEEEMQRLGDYERDRRYGELLLANLQHAERSPDGFMVTDYFDPEQARVKIPAKPGQTPQQAATAYFEQYRKSKRKVEAIGQQVAELRQELARLGTLANQLEAAVTPDQLAPLTELIQGRSAAQEARPSARARKEKIAGVYRFRSSEQHEILVGRSAEANQRLTFKLARPHDIWLHAADYPGSHVILRKPKAGPIPFPSLVEAAELAAFFSQARQEGKVVVHYTERKYVHKIRGAAPGLVRLADFKSITVEPRVRATRLDV